MLYAAVINRAEGGTDFLVIAAQDPAVAGAYAEEQMGDGDELAEITEDVEGVIDAQYGGVTLLSTTC